MGVTWSVERLPPDGCRVAVSGSVDLGAEQPVVDAVQSVINGGDHATCVLDLAGVSFIDSSGVRALMRLARSYGPRFSVGAVSEPVQRVLEISGVLDWLSTGSVQSPDDRVDGQDP